ncbi:MAG: right-handed parallel beta-helix repeat-containing protein [Phycisphaerales bacterium]|nr:right-handed parallel beta-helix repeat-containing protein [Phycisphaerales bacterium]
MERSARRFSLLVCAAACVGVGLVALAGDLNPPAGPVAPTMKSLDEVEPRVAINATNTPGDSNSVYRISQPGSYYLTGNVTAPAGDSAIEVASSDVTVDLNGFALFGEVGSMDGVTVNPGTRQVLITNGSISDFDGYGVQSDGALTTAEHLRVDGCGLTGILLNGLDANVVRDCIVGNNGTEGIDVSGQRSQILRCVAVNNSGYGIAGGPAGTISECLATGNLFAGYFVNGASNVVDCTAESNQLEGFLVGASVTMRGCNATGNQSGGISMFSGGGTIVECTVDSNQNTGIIAASGTRISSCTVVLNTGHGISVGSNCVITGCEIRLNDNDGIVGGSDNYFADNQCDTNGVGISNGAGIHVTGSDNRIDNNNVLDNDRGIDVDSAGNIIMRNTCSGNTTNYDIAANNRYGQIVSIPGAGTAAVSGSAAAGTLTSTDPWANFAY